MGMAPEVEPARRPGSALQAQQEQGSHDRQTRSERGQGGRNFRDGGGREMTTCVGEIVEVVPPKK